MKNKTWFYIEIEGVNARVVAFYASANTKATIASKWFFAGAVNLRNALYKIAKIANDKSVAAKLIDIYDCVIGGNCSHAFPIVSVSNISIADLARLVISI